MSHKLMNNEYLQKMYKTFIIIHLWYNLSNGSLLDEQKGRMREKGKEKVERNLPDFV